MAIITPDSEDYKSTIATLLKKDVASTPPLEKVNSTLIKILDTVRNIQGVVLKTKSDPRQDGKKEDEKDMSGLDKLKFIFSGFKGLKEAVKGTNTTKISSAESLEEKDALSQPKQIELDQLKVAEENKDAQKEILKELKKLNELTEEKSGSEKGGVNVDVGGGKKLGKGLAKAGRFAAGAAGGIAAGAAAVGLVGGLAYLGTRKDAQIAETKDEALGKKAEVQGGLESGSASIEEAAGMGLSKEDELFNKQTSPTVAPTPPAPKPVVTTTPSLPPPPSTTKVGGAIAATTAPETKKQPKGSKGVSSIQGEENLEKLQMAEGELQGIYKDYRDEKAKVSEKLAGDRKNYPQGFVDDPSDPEYPKELKAIDDKYKKLIDAKKKEVAELSKAPGIKEAKKAGEDFDKSLEEGTAPAKTKSTVTGEKTKTTVTTEVSGGGSETTKMVLSADAKKAEAEGPAMSKRHQAEYSELRGKLEAEGKLEGKSRREIMNMPEIKELRARQNEEENTRGKRVTDGMTYEVSKTSGENQAMRDEISSSSGGGQAIVSNNTTNTSTNNYVPIKADPRPNNRGSALDNYVGKVSSFN